MGRQGVADWSRKAAVWAGIVNIIILFTMIMMIIIHFIISMIRIITINIINSQHLYNNLFPSLISSFFKIVIVIVFDH